MYRMGVFCVHSIASRLCLTSFLCTLYELKGAFAFANGMFHAQQRIMLCQICNRIAYIFRIYLFLSSIHSHIFISLFHFILRFLLFAIWIWKCSCVCLLLVSLLRWSTMMCSLFVFCIQCEMIWAPKTPANAHNRIRLEMSFWLARKKTRKEQRIVAQGNDGGKTPRIVAFDTIPLNVM